MNKKYFIIIFSIFLIVISLVASIPQFLLFQGDVKIDGRPAPLGTLINFSIQGTELNSLIVNNEGEYGPIMIQGYGKYYGEPINITLNGYEAEQKINYIYPQDIHLNLSALTEDALKITNYFPKESKITKTKTGTQEFNITAESGYVDGIEYEWFLNSDSVSSSNSYTYTIENSDGGSYNIKVIIDDGNLTRTKEWTLIIARPVVGDFDGGTTKFSELNLDELGNVENVVLEKTSKGKIEFLENLSLIGLIDIENYVKIENGIVAIDSSNYPQLNKKAKITLTGLSYTTIPKVYYSEGFTTNPSSINNECLFCSIESYSNFPTTNGIVIFNVPHFSSFKIAGSGIKYNLSLFDHLDTCESGEQGKLNITLKKPDDGKDFNPGDKIEIKVKVKNNNEQKKKIIVEAILYNIDEDDDEIKVESDKETIKIGDSKNFELELYVPNDFNEGDRYVLFVKAYEDGEEDTQCAQKIIDVEFERENSDLKIKKLEIPSSVYPGKYLDVFINVENLGDDNEDAYIILNINKLGISEKTESFELEEYGEDNSFSEILSIKIPEDADEGNYTLNVLVDGEESEDSVSKEFSISKLKTPVHVIGDVIKLKSAETTELLLLEHSPKTNVDVINLVPKKVKITSVPFLEKDKNWLIIDSILAFFIVFTAILIAVVVKRRH